MSTAQFALTPAGVPMLVSQITEETVTCPHCGRGIPLEQASSKPGCLSVVCPYCKKDSLLVRLVSVLHRAVQLPGRLLTTLGTEGMNPVSSDAPVRTPPEVFTLPSSRGSIVLLAMMWQQAERTGSATLSATVTDLARKVLSSRSVVRGWLTELEKLGAIREVNASGKRRGQRKWELLSLTEKEGDDAGR